LAGFGISGAELPGFLIAALHSNGCDHLNEMGVAYGLHFGIHQLGQVYCVCICAFLVNVCEFYYRAFTCLKHEPLPGW
jgi:hypothetical protein